MIAELRKKLKIKSGTKICLLNPPPGYQDFLNPYDCRIENTLEGRLDWIQVFVKNKAELESVFSKSVSCLNPGGLLWVSFPKKSSGLQSDLTRDNGWECVDSVMWVTLCSINETWSAFCFRLPQKGETINDWRSKM